MIQLNGTKVVMMEQENYFESLSVSFMDYLENKRVLLEKKKFLLSKSMEDPKVYGDEEKFSGLLEEYSLLDIESLHGVFQAQCKTSREQHHDGG